MIDTTLEHNAFTEELIRQLRATDQFGNWSKMSDEELDGEICKDKRGSQKNPYYRRYR